MILRFNIKSDFKGKQLMYILITATNTVYKTARNHVLIEPTCCAVTEFRSTYPPVITVLPFSTTCKYNVTHDHKHWFTPIHPHICTE